MFTILLYHDIKEFYQFYKFTSFVIIRTVEFNSTYIRGHLVGN